MARNISYIHDYYDIQQYDAFQNMNQQHIGDLAMALLQRILKERQSIREITNIFDKDIHMPLGSSMTLFYHLLAQKIILIDMSEPLNVEQPIVIQLIDESKLKKVKYG